MIDLSQRDVSEGCLKAECGSEDPRGSLKRYLWYTIGSTSERLMNGPKVDSVLKVV